MSAVAKITLFTAFMIAGAVLVFATWVYNKPHTYIPDARPDFVFSAAGLQKEFASDESAATVKYVNKTIEVTGTVLSVKSDNGKIISVILKTDDEFSTVICTLGRDAGQQSVNENETVTVKGELSGFLMDVLLNNCVIIK